MQRYQGLFNLFDFFFFFEFKKKKKKKKKKSYQGPLELNTGTLLFKKIVKMKKKVMKTKKIR